MARKIDVSQEDNHIYGNFKWEIPPKCCDQLNNALDEQFVFVSNFTDEKWNTFYMLPVNSNGYLARDTGIPISHCPWCGKKLQARKKYPTTG